MIIMGISNEKKDWYWITISLVKRSHYILMISNLSWILRMAPKSYVNPEGSSLILFLFQTFRFLLKLLTQLLFTFLSVDNALTSLSSSGENISIFFLSNHIYTLSVLIFLPALLWQVRRWFSSGLMQSLLFSLNLQPLPLSSLLIWHK